MQMENKTAHLNNNQKLNEIMFLFNHIAEIVEFNLYDESEFLDYNKDEYDYSDENNSSSKNELNEK